MSDCFAHLRYAARGLLRRPGFAVTTEALAGIGIGASIGHVREGTQQ